jgi:hypothetical protein
MKPRHYNKLSKILSQSVHPNRNWSSESPDLSPNAIVKLHLRLILRSACFVELHCPMSSQQTEVKAATQATPITTPFSIRKIFPYCIGFFLFVVVLAVFVPLNPQMPSAGWTHPGSSP